MWVTVGNTGKALSFWAIASKWGDAGYGKRAAQRFEIRIRMRTKRTRGDSLATIIAELNPTLRGWFNYFKHAHPGTFKRMEAFVRRRLRAVLRKTRSDPVWDVVEMIISA